MYKKYVDKAGVLHMHLGKLWKIMRLITIIMTLTIIQVSAAGYAQRLSISRSNASLKTVMKEIKSKVDFDFICTDNLFRKSKLVNIDVKDMELVALLEKTFEDQPLTYIIDSKTIVIKESTKSADEPSLLERITKQLQVIEVSGRVVDEKGLPLLGAIVRLKKEKRSYPTNRNGEFSIRCPDENEIICFSFVGYITKELPAQAVLKKPLVRLEVDINNLKEVGIQSTKNIGTKIDLNHRSHQNLAQVLEGGVPGLTLKSSRQTTVGPTVLHLNGVTHTKREMYDLLHHKVYPTFEDYEKGVANGEAKAGAVINSPSPGGGSIRGQYKATTTTTNSGVVPELRGGSGFAAGTAGMLVVIDGFVQDEFPANYPMNNVASIEIIKDLTECLKWGARGAGGVILITTNSANPGKLQINYNSNFYFSPRPDISAEKLRLASTADLLDYYKEVYDKQLANYFSNNPSLNDPMPQYLSPAEMLLFSLKTKRLTPQRFQYKWDSLAMISNRDQLRLLQTHAFNQNHSLSVLGGTGHNRFTVGAIYANERSNSLGDVNQRFGLNLKDNLSLFKDKLKIKWIADLTSIKSRTGTGEDGATLDPYQLLLDKQGKYVYDYSNITPDINSKMLKLGYHDNGVNILEDIRNNINISKSLRINSSLDLNWKITDNLLWNTSVRYQRTAKNTENLQGESSSGARELINDYGSSVDDPGNVDKVIFYVPPGGILKKKVTRDYEYNLRSGFKFNQVFGADHWVTATFDGGLANQESNGNPNATLYGYNPNTRKGLPILTSLESNIRNYVGSSMYLKKLLTLELNSSTYARSISLNADLTYSYLKRYSVEAKYATVFIPNFGGTLPYATTSNRSVSGWWQINKESFFNAKWISNLKFAIALAEMQVARLPNQVIAERVLQPLWNNAAIAVSSYNAAQQNGQKNQNLGAQLDIGLSENHFSLILGYSRNSIGRKHQWNARLFYDIAKEPYFHFPLISSLQADVSLQDITPYKGLEIMMSSNSLSSNGGFATPGNNSLGLLPDDLRNKEAHLMIGIAEDRFVLDLRYYRRITAGLSTSSRPADPTTGLSSQVSYNKTLNKGAEVSFKAGIIKGKTFDWTVTINGAYNVNQAIDVPPVNFSLSQDYLTAPRNGYNSDNLWSFRWAGLDTLGNPQIYNKDMQKVTEPDSLSLIYVGTTRPPWSGAVMQEWRYKGFFASARLIFNLGHVMRRYKPVFSTLKKEKSIEIRDRWRKPGDEAFTDVAGVSKDNAIRELIIQGSDNAVISANHLRLREVQFGYQISPETLKGKFIKGLTLSAQIQNVALWTKNKMHLDPETVSNIGVVGVTPPKNYVLSINMNF